MADTPPNVLDGSVRFPMSVSGVWSRFFDHFDPEATIDKYFHRWAADSTSKYYLQIQTARSSGDTDTQIQ